jgi:hypothetical protein
VGRRGAARGIVGEVKAVTPQTRKAYDEAGLAAARTAHSVVDPALKGLPQNSLSAAVKIEQADYRRNLQESKAAELADLGSRRVSAREGAAFAVTNAASVRNSDLAKYNARYQALRQEKGAFEALTTATLTDDARQRRQQLRIAMAGLRERDRISRRSAQQQERNSRRSAAAVGAQLVAVGGDRPEDGQGRSRAASSTRSAQAQEGRPDALRVPEVADQHRGDRVGGEALRTRRTGMAVR